jgi:hypothetical protein
MESAAYEKQAKTKTGQVMTIITFDYTFIFLFESLICETQIQSHWGANDENSWNC